jgi:hypothetical protein
MGFWWGERVILWNEQICNIKALGYRYLGDRSDRGKIWVGVWIGLKGIFRVFRAVRGVRLEGSCILWMRRMWM